MGYSSRVNWETLRSIDSTTLTGGYDALGGPLENPSFILKLINNSDTLVTVSKNGSTDVDVLPPYSYFLYDENKFEPGRTSAPANTQFFVKGSAGTTGSIYLVTQYLVVT